MREVNLSSFSVYRSFPRVFATTLQRHQNVDLSADLCSSTSLQLTTEALQHTTKPLSTDGRARPHPPGRAQRDHPTKREVAEHGCDGREPSQRHAGAVPRVHLAAPAVVRGLTLLRYWIHHPPGPPLAACADRLISRYSRCTYSILRRASRSSTPESPQGRARTAASSCRACGIGIPRRRADATMCSARRPPGFRLSNAPSQAPEHVDAAAGRVGRRVLHRKVRDPCLPVEVSGELLGCIVEQTRALGKVVRVVVE